MLRIGIVGTGAMAEYHAKRFSGIEGARVSAVCDHLPSRAAAFAEPRSLAAYSDPEDMAASGSVDAFAVASFDGWHSAPALAALGRGLPVFCEKPLARTLQDAAAMARAAELSGVPAIVNFSKRNGGLLSLARRIVADGSLGQGLAIRLSYLQSWLLQDSWGDFRTSARWKWRLSESLSTHGALGDLGCHLIDAALLLAGPGLEAESCSATRFLDGSPPEGQDPLEPEGGPAFEAFEARLRSPTAPALAAGNFRAEGRIDSFVIGAAGGSGSLELDLERSRDSLVLAGSGGASRVLRAAPCPSTYERFVAIASGAEDPVRGEGIDFARGLEVQRLIEGCAGSARDRTVV